jgi:hypothetical protein
MPRRRSNAIRWSFDKLRTNGYGYKARCESTQLVFISALISGEFFNV